MNTSRSLTECFRFWVMAVTGVHLLQGTQMLSVCSLMNILNNLCSRIEKNVLSTGSVYEVAELKFSYVTCFIWQMCIDFEKLFTLAKKAYMYMCIDNSLLLCISNSCMMGVFSQCVFLRSSTEILDRYECFHLLCTNTFCILVLSILLYQVAYNFIRSLLKIRDRNMFAIISVIWFGLYVVVWHCWECFNVFWRRKNDFR